MERTTSYRKHHGLQFSVHVSERSTSSTTAVFPVKCFFCMYFVPEEKVRAKQGRTIHTKYFKLNFCTDCYTQHHHKQHTERCKEYQANNDTGKKAFFEEQLPLEETLNGFFVKKITKKTL